MYVCVIRCIDEMKQSMIADWTWLNCANGLSLSHIYIYIYGSHYQSIAYMSVALIIKILSPTKSDFVNSITIFNILSLIYVVFFIFVTFSRWFIFHKDIAVDWPLWIFTFYLFQASTTKNVHIRMMKWLPDVVLGNEAEISTGFAAIHLGFVALKKKYI